MARSSRVPKFVEYSLTVFAFLGVTLYAVQFFRSGISVRREHLFLMKSLRFADFLKTRKITDKITGELAVHVWNSLCLRSISELVSSPYYPHLPDVEYFINSSEAFWGNRHYVQRIQGYLTPSETGYYKFALFSMDASELWLSDESGRTVLIASTAIFPRQDSSVQSAVRSLGKAQISQKLFLKKGISYVMEIFHMQAQIRSIVQVHWLQPGGHQFQPIGTEFLSRDKEPRTIPPQTLQRVQRTESKAPNFFQVAFLTQWIWNAAIPSCDFQVRTLRNSGYVNRKNRDKGLVRTLYRDEEGIGANTWQRVTEARDVVSMYMKGLEKVFAGKYLPQRLFNFEEFPSHKGQGSLYLFEIQLEVDGLDYPERVVDYIYRPNMTFICYPRSLAWNRDSTINLIVAVGDQAKWIRIFLSKLQRIYEDTLEVDFNLIVVDFGGSGIDIKALLQRTSIEKYQVLTMKGVYSRSRGLNAGVQFAKGKYPIVLTYDVRIDIPTMIFEDTKKHCVARNMAFAPIAYQLDCGSHPGMQNPSGQWRYHGYEIIGIFKSDWDKVGGMDESKVGREAEQNFLNRTSKAGLHTAHIEYHKLFRHYEGFAHQSTKPAVRN